MTATTQRRVLVVEHEPDAPAAWLGEALERRGVRLVVARPHAGEPVPGPEGFDGVVVLGGAMDAWDDARTPWLPAVRDLVRRAEATGVPVLGICLGHQLATLALGGEVARNPAGGTVAVVPIGWAGDAGDDPLLGRLAGAPWAVHWNNDVVVRLPEGARLLASSPDGAVQAARLGRHVWGVQFHPEASPAVLADWVAEYGRQFAEHGYDLEAYLAAARRCAAELETTCDRLAEAFTLVMAEALQ